MSVETQPRRVRLAVLISGQGRNLQALIDACLNGTVDADIAVVISSREDAYGLERARQAGIQTEVLTAGDYADRAAYDRALSACIDRYVADYVVLAGFMRILTADFVSQYVGRMLNIHPSLLPRHPGLHTHRRVLEAGEREHGASVHFVTADLDAGPLIIQGQFIVDPQDTEQVLAERVMHEIEVKIYPQAIAWLVSGVLSLDQGQVIFHGQPLKAPLGLDALEGAFR